MNIPVEAVLDTQAVLDWLYFADPATQHWDQAWQSGAWVWLAADAMRDELAHVLARGLPAGRGLPPDAVLAAFDQRAQRRAAPVALGHGPLRCSDPDDQKFIDFAVAHRVRWLVSRDRAVLKLRRRMLAQHAVQILRPVEWSAALSVSGAAAHAL